MENFNINHRFTKDCHILELHGKLDAQTASALEDAFQTQIAKHHYHIICNFSGLDYIASAGLGVFMAYIEEVREHGGDIKLTNMKREVFNIFDLLGFPALYDILDDEADAVQMFNQSSPSVTN
jgi:anti-sigma B factor antagonist